MSGTGQNDSPFNAIGRPAGPDAARSSAAHGPRPAAAEDDLVIRPFLLTGGRTRPECDYLRVETLIQARPGVMTALLRFEARKIVELCRQPTSVAELAAALRVPLGVARVLVSDLMANDSVSIVESGTLSIQLIERIRDRVSAL